jgi:DHA1 family bicyclomycin/chloramphenicol resistance-like MFS transporter
MTTAISDGRRRVRRPEFTAVLAFSMALTALGIDLMLPAFGAIRFDLGLAEDSTAIAGLVTAYFLGLAVGQLAYGPIADRFGRRPALYAGYIVYGLAALVTALAPTLPLLLVARFVWGVGAAGPRVVTLAMVRDAFEGEQMSRTMSMIMAVFILVPVVAPTVGAAVAAVSSWRWLCAGRRRAVAVGVATTRDAARPAPTGVAVRTRRRRRTSGGVQQAGRRLRPGHDGAVRRVHVVPRQRRDHLR